MGFNFDASGQQFAYTTTPIVAQLPFTVSLWFLSPDVASGNGLYALASFADRRLTTASYMMFIQANSSVLSAWHLLPGQASTATTSNGAIEVVPSWHHVAAVFEPGSRFCVLDGDLANAGSASALIDPVQVTQDGLAANLGITGTESMHYPGWLAEFAVWEGLAMPGEWIQALARRTSPQFVYPQFLKERFPLIRDLRSQITTAVLSSDSPLETVQHVPLVEPAPPIALAPPRVSVVPQIVDSHRRRRSA